MPRTVALHRGPAALMALALAAILSLSACGFKLPFLQDEPQDPISVTIPLEAEGLDEEGTRIPVRITPDAEGSAYSDAYVDASGGGVTLVPGSYSIRVVGSPISKDGTIYQRPQEPIALEVLAGTNGDPSRVATQGTLVLTPIDPAEVSVGQIDDARTWALRDPLRKDVAEELAQRALEGRDAALWAIQQEHEAEEAAKKAQEEEEARKEAEAKAQELAENTYYLYGCSFVMPEPWREELVVQNPGMIVKPGDGYAPIVIFVDPSNNYYADPSIPGDVETLRNGNTLKLTPGDDAAMAALVTDADGNIALFYTQIIDPNIDLVSEFFTPEQQAEYRRLQSLAGGLTPDSDPHALARACLREVAESVAFG